MYLLFNEGYSATSGDDLVRITLCEEAIRLGHTLVELMPDEPEVRGLLALMLLHHARRNARVDAAGDLVTLEHQDRSRWDRDEIAAGLAELERAERREQRGPYQVHAAIVACHAVAPTPGDTDWVRIVALYDELALLLPTPVVALNRAVAVAMAWGPEAALPLLDDLEQSGDLAAYHHLPATRADLLRRLGRDDEAADAYRAALALTTAPAECRYLQGRLDALVGAG